MLPPWAQTLCIIIYGLWILLRCRPCFCAVDYPVIKEGTNYTMECLGSTTTRNRSVFWRVNSSDVFKCYSDCDQECNLSQPDEYHGCYQSLDKTSFSMNLTVQVTPQQRNAVVQCLVFDKADDKSEILHTWNFAHNYHLTDPPNCSYTVTECHTIDITCDIQKVYPGAICKLASSNQQNAVTMQSQSNNTENYLSVFCQYTVFPTKRGHYNFTVEISPNVTSKNLRPIIWRTDTINITGEPVIKVQQLPPSHCDENTTPSIQVNCTACWLPATAELTWDYNVSTGNPASNVSDSRILERGSEYIDINSTLYLHLDLATQSDHIFATCIAKNKSDRVTIASKTAKLEVRCPFIVIRKNKLNQSQLHVTITVVIVLIIFFLSLIITVICVWIKPRCQIKFPSLCTWMRQRGPPANVYEEIDENQMCLQSNSDQVPETSTGHTTQNNISAEDSRNIEDFDPTLPQFCDNDIHVCQLCHRCSDAQSSSFIGSDIHLESSTLVDHPEINSARSAVLRDEHDGLVQHSRRVCFSVPCSQHRRSNIKRSCICNKRGISHPLPTQSRDVFCFHFCNAENHKRVNSQDGNTDINKTSRSRYCNVIIQDKARSRYCNVPEKSPSRYCNVKIPEKAPSRYCNVEIPEKSPSRYCNIEIPEKAPSRYCNVPTQEQSDPGQGKEDDQATLPSRYCNVKNQDTSPLRHCNVDNHEASPPQYCTTETGDILLSQSSNIESQGATSSKYCDVRSNIPSKSSYNDGDNIARPCLRHHNAQTRVNSAPVPQSCDNVRPFQRVSVEVQREPSTHDCGYKPDGDTHYPQCSGEAPNKPLPPTPPSPLSSSASSSSSSISSSVCDFCSTSAQYNQSHQCRNYNRSNRHCLSIQSPPLSAHGETGWEQPRPCELPLPSPALLSPQQSSPASPKSPFPLSFPPVPPRKPATPPLPPREPLNQTKPPNGRNRPKSN